jgi:CarboxypepD_reg-like domain/TonB-dependent Receptor Plug Domain
MQAYLFHFFIQVFCETNFMRYLTSYVGTCFAITFLSLSTLSGQNIHLSTKILSGAVIEATSRETLIGITIQLRSTTNSQQRFGTRSNKNGIFTLPAVPVGEYDVSVRTIGYKPFTKHITLQDNARLDIALEQEDIRLQRVSVEAEQSAPALVSVVSLSAGDIKRMPSLGAEADVMRAIQLLPGVKSANELSSGLYVRGSTPEQTLILFDGVTIYNPAHLFGIFSSFNPDAVSDLKLYKGAFPAEYGGRLSSVLDITMKEGSKERLGGSASISLLSAHAFLEGPISENIRFMVSGRSMYFGALAEVLKLNNTIPIYNFYDLNAKLTATLSENDRISASGYFGRDDLKASQANGGFNFGWDNTTGQIKWTHLFSPVFFTSVAASYSSYNYDYRDEVSSTFLAAEALQTFSSIADI